jgi:hypothetical protein
MINDLLFYNMFTPLPTDYDIPPTIYSILNSYVNFNNDDPVKISNLASAGRGVIFDFDYPLTTNITKESFEVMILNNFLMRRIGYDTVTAFKIALSVKLNEIMPKYNKLFDSMHNWDLFNDGETITRQYSSTINNTGTTGSISDRRYSDTPQNQLSDIRDGRYVTDYNYDCDSSNISNSGTETRAENEHRSLPNKEELYITFSKEVNNVYTLIFKELEPLFYGLA